MMSEEANQGEKDYMDENNDNSLTPEEKLKSNRILLELMTHVYDEDERRNALIDSKNSQMIILTASMVTLQVTFISKLLIDTIFLNPYISVGYWCKVVLSILLFLSTLGYFISMYNFIRAYTFRDDYQRAPGIDSVIDTIECNVSEADIVFEMPYVYHEALSKNKAILDEKIDEANKGFLFLRISSALSLVFLILFIFVLFSYPINF